MTPQELLREKALKVILQSSQVEDEEISMKDLKELYSELRIHKIELELQNEELRSARSKVEESRKKYRELYDHAPVGYFNFDKEGIIKKVNKHGGALLGTPREFLVARRFQHFVMEEYKESFHTFLRRIFKTRQIETEDIQVFDKQGNLVYLHLEGLANKVEPDLCMVTATDITSLRKAQEIIKTSLDEKERLQIIVSTQDEERRNISEALHNSVAQSLFALQLFVECNKEAVQPKIRERLLNDLYACIDEIRTVSYELMPPILEEFGLKESLLKLCSKKSSPQLPISFTCKGTMNRYKAHLEIGIYRIIQELVNNIQKHSQASRASIFTEEYKNHFRIFAEDNGKGFDHVLELENQNGTGLRTIRNRIHVMNGVINLESSPGRGTRIDVEIPL